jgi:hypothetical protein
VYVWQSILVWQILSLDAVQCSSAFFCTVLLAPNSFLKVVRPKRPTPSWTHPSKTAAKSCTLVWWMLLQIASPHRATFVPAVISCLRILSQGGLERRVRSHSSCVQIAQDCILTENLAAHRLLLHLRLLLDHHLSHPSSSSINQDRKGPDRFA